MTACYPRTWMLLQTALLIALCFAAAGCRLNKSTCVTCHTDKERLKELADPIDIPPSTGEG